MVKKKVVYFHFRDPPVGLIVLSNYKLTFTVVTFPIPPTNAIMVSRPILALGDLVSSISIKTELSKGPRSAVIEDKLSSSFSSST